MKFAVGVSCLLLVVVVWSGQVLVSEWSRPLSIPAEGYVLTVEAGDSLQRVADELSDRGMLGHPMLMRLYGRYTGLDQQIKKGEYLLPTGSTVQSILMLLQSGRVVQYKVTFPEGITLAQALRILAAQETLQHLLVGPQDDRILSLVAPHASGEGLILPESYFYSRGTSDWQLVQRAHRAMSDTLSREWQNRAENLPYKTPYEALIMASIIERETGLSAERARISGVFVRRLQRGMRLQSDPTVIYGMGDSYTGNIKRRHLADSANSYNSYRHAGLPPTPIALPGRAAIRAALHPAPGGAMYFVARGDGGHEFSATLAEHKSAVRKYQIRRQEGYRSAPERQ